MKKTCPVVDIDQLLRAHRRPMSVYSGSPDMHTLLMNLLLLLTGFFIYRVCRIVARVTKHQPSAQQWRDNLRFIGIIMTVCLLSNAMAYGKGALILWHMEETQPCCH